ncbi:MAG TPA: acyl carrier protein [Acidimicrobiales bacterium]|nr:acyl carrier protein [Acidimicrobiales bacterium]
MSDAITEEIRGILATYAQLVVDVAAVDDGDDLFDAGLNSTATVSIMLALEQIFDVEFPEHLLRRSTFTSIATIRAAVAELGVQGAVA